MNRSKDLGSRNASALEVMSGMKASRRNTRRSRKELDTISLLIRPQPFDIVGGACRYFGQINQAPSYRCCGGEGMQVFWLDQLGPALLILWGGEACRCFGQINYAPTFRYCGGNACSCLVRSSRPQSFDIVRGMHAGALVWLDQLGPTLSILQGMHAGALVWLDQLGPNLSIVWGNACRCFGQIIQAPPY